MAERPDYDVLVKDINLEDITSCERNANILRMLRDGDSNLGNRLFIVNEEDDDGDINDFLVEKGNDLGFLGYLIGHSEVLEELYIHYLPEGGDQINRFLDGMSRNRSIKSMVIYCEIGIDGWNGVGNFIENNHNLSHLEFEGIMIGHEGAQNLASALGRMNHRSLENLTMNSTHIGDEGFAEIATALRLHPQLKILELNYNNTGRSGCIALGNTLSSWSASNKLRTLSLDDNEIDDGELQALGSGMMNCRSLKVLCLSYNLSITAAGLKSLSPVFQSESHSLETLILNGINFGDDGAMVLAEGLRGNKSLKELMFGPETACITTVGWSAFSKLLCDTSTINNTYISNHTLTNIGNHENEGTPQCILDYLALNKSIFTDAAMCKSKILRSHLDLDMGPFFEWKMKFLPVAISWLQRAHSSRLGRESNKKNASRKLSAMYKFVRAMPDLAVSGYWQGRVIYIEAKKRMLDDEEAVAWERLGGRPIDDGSKRKRMRHE